VGGEKKEEEGSRGIESGMGWRRGCGVWGRSEERVAVGGGKGGVGMRVWEEHSGQKQRNGTCARKAGREGGMKERRGVVRGGLKEGRGEGKVESRGEGRYVARRGGQGGRR